VVSYCRLLKYLQLFIVTAYNNIINGTALISSYRSIDKPYTRVLYFFDNKFKIDVTIVMCTKGHHSVLVL
jgi:hypothetical protein